MRAALLIGLVLILGVAAARAEEETTNADEFELVAATSRVASERTDIIEGGVAAEKPHQNVAAEEVRFQSVEAEAEAEAAHAAEMEVHTEKKRGRWPASPDHPAKGRGCYITQTHCVRHPNKFVGTFRDSWGEKNVNAGSDEAKCLARAQEYHVYCGNPHTVSTTAKFRNTQRQASYPATGCWIHQSTCNRDSTWTGVFRDTWGEKKLSTATDEARCMKRAREYAVWCGNSKRHSTMAEFRTSGNTAYYPAGKGCFISHDLCVNHPATASPWPFRDLYGEKHVQAGKKQSNCHARAREYHAWCGNPASAPTTAEFRPSMKAASYPATYKVQIDRKYKFGKVSWTDSESYCKSKGKNLCMRSELCPNGFPKRGRPQGDHWIAVRDMENGWAAIGTDSSDRLCQLHQDIDGGHYGKPSWGFDKYNHPQICCDDPDEVVWAKTLALSESITWKDAKKACSADGLSLCPKSVYCPDGSGKPPAGGITEGDHWAPTNDYPNSWVSVGDYQAAKRICRLHDVIAGPPAWGTQPSTYKFKGHVRCCAKDNACKSSPCQHGSKCIPGANNSFKCVCKKGFTGTNCQAEDKCATANPCKRGAECESLGSGDYRCHCPAGYSGKNCGKKDACSLSPCKNGAKCKNSKKVRRGYKCACAAGFSGKTCAKRDPCTSSPCKNGAKCIRDSSKKYHCKCLNGFRGADCAENIDDCTPTAIASCKNGGKCVDGIASFTCDCAGTKFAGPACTQYSLKGFAEVPAGHGELFIDDDQRNDDLGAKHVPIKSYALPGSSVEIQGKLLAGQPAGIIASFSFRKGKFVTGSDWECSVDGGKTYRRAKVLEGRELPADVDASAKYIWAKNEKADSVTCRMNLPMKNLAAGTRIVLPVKNKISPLCSRGNGASITYYYGEVCANGGVQWNHMHTKNRKRGLTQTQCAWSRKAMKGNSQWIANWLGSCTEAPKMLFPKLPTARASFYTKARVEEDSCKGKNTCHPNADCKTSRMGPMPFKCTCRKGYAGDGKTCVEIDNCANSPCDKNARCRRTGPGTHTCSCKPGFIGSGEQCEAVNNCKASISPCSPRATCTMSGPGTHTCKCNTGYKGDGKKCKAINSCRVKGKKGSKRGPCAKGAICAPTGPGQHRCTCKSGFKGDGVKKCKAINACKKKPCDRNADCFKTGPNKYRCECKKGWKGTGKQCAEVNMCKASKPCHASATCTHKGAGKYECTCHKGFTGDGKSCAEVDMCATTKPCDKNALCTKTGPGTFTCACKDGFNGDGHTCKEVDVCKSDLNPCHPTKAKCIKSGPGAASCKCRKGYEGDGKKCRAINVCKTKTPCDVNAKCKMTGPGKYKCTCKTGYMGSGKVCHEFDKCTEKPCDAHATCTSTGPGTYKCSCGEGFRGDGYSCSEINDCDVGGLCNDNANCMKTGPGTHKCICKAGFRGDGVHCTEIDACADHPCHEKAQCIKTTPGNFKCQCINGFEGTGRVCKAINACTKQPCGEHSTCTSTGPATYTCACQRGFRGNGKICNEIDSCKERPCPARSTCLKTGPGRHRCKCDSGYRWSRAAKGCVGIDGCKLRAGMKAPCAAEAKCASTGPGTVSCACKKGYEGDGKTCTPVNSCKSNPCGAGEQCTSTGAGTHKCVCQKGFRRSSPAAKTCDPINQCADAAAAKKTLCGKNGTCRYTKPGKYHCDCKTGFHRVHVPGTKKSEVRKAKCVEIKGCDKNPCSPYAKCTNKALGAFECKCKKGFSGDGHTCVVQPGFKAVTINGKVSIVPMVKGDKHDSQLGVIEAMLGKLADDGTTPAPGAKPVVAGAPEPNADGRSALAAVAAQVNSLEKSAEAMAAEAKAETEALLALQRQSRAENEKLMAALSAKTDSILDKAVDVTHDVMVHTPHDEGRHGAAADASSPAVSSSKKF